MNAHRLSAVRIKRSSGFPCSVVNSSTVTAAIASAWVRRVVAATLGHFISTNEHACVYHDTFRPARRIDTGLPDSMSNASPLRVAETSSDRKLSANAAVLKGSFHSLPSTLHLT